MELLNLDCQLDFNEYSRRNHYIREEISAEFIHFNAICDLEVERCLTIQERGFDTPPMCDCTDTVHLYNLQCIDNEDDKTMMPFSPEEMEYIKEIIKDELTNKLDKI